MWCMWMWNNLSWWSIKKRNIFLLQQNMCWRLNWMGLCFHGLEGKSFFYWILHRNDMMLQDQFNQLCKFHESKYISQVFFSWISAFKIDFRKHIEPWCEHTPKVLACDGTHIGVSTRNLILSKPVTGVDDIDHTSITQHKCYDCVFVSNKDARLHLNYLCRKIINKLKPNEKLEEREEMQHTQKTFEVVTDIDDDVLTHTVRALIEQRLPKEVIKTLARLFSCYARMHLSHLLHHLGVTQLSTSVLGMWDCMMLFQPKLENWRNIALRGQILLWPVWSMTHQTLEQLSVSTWY